MPSQSAEVLASVYHLIHNRPSNTSDSSTSGGPSIMSSALVPGRMRLEAPLSRELKSFCCSSVAGSGESWSSAIGGGLGRRGELDGEGAEAIVRRGYREGPKR